MAEKREPWLNYLALSSVVLAICAALSTFNEGKYSTHSLISQTQASEQWCYYQSKTIKSYLYQAQRDAIQLTLDTLPARTAAAEQLIYLAKIAEYDKRINQYELEKTYIQKNAQRLETQRDEAQQRRHPFSLAVIFLHTAILHSAIAALLRYKFIWYMSLPIACGGLLFFANGVLLFF